MLHTFICIMFTHGKIDILILQLHSKSQVRPSTFKKANLVSQLLFLGQITTIEILIEAGKKH